MSDHPHDRRPRPAVEEAVDWFVRHDAGALSVAERAAFDIWLAADPAHRAAYTEIERIWSDFDRMPAGRAPRLRIVDGTGAEAEIAASSDRRAPRWRSWRWSAIGAVAASLCLFAVIGTDVPTRLQADALSGVGETKALTLPDGSTAVLNTATAIAIDYTPDERRVRLLRGEAEFTVAKDADRPFHVEAEGGLSTALGTVFLVRQRDEGATVTVLESRVAVAYGGDPEAAQETVLAPNQQVTYAAGRGLGPVEMVDPQAATAWRRGKLIFVDCTLGEVIEELNRYHFGEIWILDDSLRSKKISGVFETHDPVAVVDALETSLGLHSTRLSDLLILLHR